MATKATAALKAEAVQTELTVEFRGDTYTLPKDVEDWSLEAYEAFEDGKPVAALRGVLGPEQWAKVKAHGLRVRDLEEVADVFFGAIGLSSGKSES